jgi:DnaJ family protein C protein 28
MPNIEELLHKAMQDGKFDNLPGKGKPLRLDGSNPYSDPEWELAYKMLKESGYSLPWIETIREIEKDIESARQDLRLAWKWRTESIAASRPGSTIFAEWDRAQKSFKEKLSTLNKRIRDYNLQTPTARCQRPLLNVEAEIKKLTEHPGESAS